MTLVLASSSPRRQELLRAAGIPFVVQPSDIDETRRTGEAAVEFTTRLAKEKALAVADKNPDAFVLGADTTVVVGDEILEKPRDRADAVRMLRLLSGNTHKVITGVCLLPPQVNGLSSGARRAADVRALKVESETTLVTMSALSDDDIADYVASGDPMDKAGAYGIQGVASRWIVRIEGDYSNVVGLPVARVWRMLREAGVE